MQSSTLTNNKGWLKLALFLLVWCQPHVVLAQQEKLEDIQQQIKQKQKTIEVQLAAAKKLEDELRRAELEIAATAKALNTTQINLENNTYQRKHLEKEQKSLQGKQRQQQGILAKQIRSAFMAGNHDYAKMLFNQEDAGKFERILSYYQYLNKARQQQIDAFRELVQQLQKVNQELLEKQQELESLQDTQKEQKNRLALQQNTRKSTLAKIEKVIDSEAAKIEQLQINEQALLKAIEEAARAALQRPSELAGLSKLKGKLALPAQGRMRRLFGTRRQGQVRWKGILIDSTSGSAVRTVHDGKILYADWLRGFGLVTVVDHGEGYMSLYGHNQALLKQAGDAVEAGETIALVGQSGGQNSPNLYFEIRHKGKAINPSAWLARR